MFHGTTSAQSVGKKHHTATLLHRSKTNQKNFRNPPLEIVNTKEPETCAICAKSCRAMKKLNQQISRKEISVIALPVCFDGFYTAKSLLSLNYKLNITTSGTFYCCTNHAFCNFCANLISVTKCNSF
ncbi:MAG: PRD domain-containing protein [Puniceicoccales bacterium]|nr:PRD domain-containing protein [Puniceicoccales bacterium]